MGWPRAKRDGQAPSGFWIDHSGILYECYAGSDIMQGMSNSLFDCPCIDREDKGAILGTPRRRGLFDQLTSVAVVDSALL